MLAANMSGAHDSATFHVPTTSPPQLAPFPQAAPAPPSEPPLQPANRALKEIASATRNTRGDAEPPGVDDAALRPFGLVGEARRDEIRRLAVDSVVGPRASALLASAETGLANAVPSVSTCVDRARRIRAGRPKLELTLGGQHGAADNSHETDVLRLPVDA